MSFLRTRLLGARLRLARLLSSVRAPSPATALFVFLGVLAFTLVVSTSLAYTTRPNRYQPVEPATPSAMSPALAKDLTSFLVTSPPPSPTPSTPTPNTAASATPPRAPAPTRAPRTPGTHPNKHPNKHPDKLTGQILTDKVTRPGHAVPVVPPGGPRAPSLPPVTPQVVTHTAHPTGRWVALTFDDGPTPAYTPQVLALLRRYQVKATFCVVGTQARKHPGLVRRIVAEGHLLCNHTMTHDQRLPHRSRAAIRNEMRRADAALHAAVPGARIGYYRAPGGAWSLTVRQVATSMNMKSLGWSVDTRDWQQPGTGVILANVRRELAPGGVILMHDGGGERAQSLAALRQLLVSLPASGYRFDFPG